MTAAFSAAVAAAPEMDRLAGWNVAPEPAQWAMKVSTGSEVILGCGLALVSSEHV